MIMIWFINNDYRFLINYIINSTIILFETQFLNIIYYLKRHHR